MHAIPLDITIVEVLSLITIIGLFAIGTIINVVTDSAYARVIDRVILLSIIVTCFIAPWVGAIFLVLLLTYVWYVIDYIVLSDEPNLRPSEHYRLVGKIFLQQLTR